MVAIVNQNTFYNGKSCSCKIFSNVFSSRNPVNGVECILYYRCLKPLSLRHKMLRLMLGCQHDTNFPSFSSNCCKPQKWKKRSWVFFCSVYTIEWRPECSLTFSSCQWCFTNKTIITIITWIHWGIAGVKRSMSFSTTVQCRNLDYPCVHAYVTRKNSAFKTTFCAQCQFNPCFLCPWCERSNTNMTLTLPKTRPM